MGKLFDLESPLFSGLNKMADLIYLNLLTFVCCIPIITIGASMTALNYVVLKMVRNEDSHLTRQFFKSFKQNFKQATIIWLIILLAIIVLAGDFYIFTCQSVAVGRSVQRLHSGQRLLCGVVCDRKTKRAAEEADCGVARHDAAAECVY